MKETKTAKRGPAAIYGLCPKRHILLLLSLALIALHLVTREHKTLMSAVSERLVRPVHAFLARLSSLLPFSLAELLVVSFVLAVLVYIVLVLFSLRKREGRWQRLYKALVTLSGAGLAVYALFSLLWGVYYYGDSFMERSGLSEEPVSLEQLETVTEYFARLANDNSALVARDERGFCCIDRSGVLERSARIYEAAESEFPCLSGPGVEAKGLILSRVLSHMNYTGFFFPFTGEANVNTDFPPALFASTVAHELAHQRGVAQEQHANFVAVLASLKSEDTDYRYSAALLAYTYLGNALHDVNREAWQRIYESLNEQVHMDLAVNRYYWAQFDSAVQELSDSLYESFLYSYEQELGLKSYGACVDLLVNYYYDAALESAPAS